MDQFPVTGPFHGMGVFICVFTFKFHECPLSEFAVTHCLHNDVGSNETSFVAVPNEQACIAELIDQTRGSVSPGSHYCSLSGNRAV